jgi:predicted LPLAT superfamily acyltransferase
MPADRILGSNKSIELEFLQGRAKFPIGPFSVATMRGLNVLAVNVMKTAVKTYIIYVTPLEYDKSAPRKVQIENLSKRYVSELERMLQLYPTQWYNYYNFWL